MYTGVDWFSPADYAIVSVLMESGLSLSPSVIAINIEYSRGHVQRRTRELERRGLIEIVGEEGGPYYRNTALGDQVARRELTLEELAERANDPESFET